MTITFERHVATCIALVRKGIDCHSELVKKLFVGMGFTDKDVVIWIDLVPNTQLSSALMTHFFMTKYYFE